MQKSFDETPTPSTLVTLGLGYLWAGGYGAASKLFQDWHEKYGVTADAYSALAGVAQWCLGDIAGASESWRSGLNAQYLDMAGGIQSPLLLWVASVLSANDILHRDAIRILGQKVKSPKVRHWPGPLAQFVLNEIDERTLEERSTERLSQKTPPRMKWQIAFYRRVVELERRVLDVNQFKVAIRELVDTSTLEWSDDESFLQLVRNPEFYIARHEALTERAPTGQGTRHDRIC